jgi:hypothetical protein
LGRPATVAAETAAAAAAAAAAIAVTVLKPTLAMLAVAAAREAAVGTPWLRAVCQSDRQCSGAID